ADLVGHAGARDGSRGGCGALGAGVSARLRRRADRRRAAGRGGVMSALEPAASLALRDLTFGDLPRVVEIEKSCFSTPWQRSTFESLMHRTDADLIGAFSGGVLVGYAVTWTILDQSELGNVAVSPDARGRGLGRLLVETALGRIRARGA